MSRLTENYIEDVWALAKTFCLLPLKLMCGEIGLKDAEKAVEAVA